MARSVTDVILIINSSLKNLKNNIKDYNDQEIEDELLKLCNINEELNIQIKKIIDFNIKEVGIDL